jgi:hypothetical protein
LVTTPYALLDLPSFVGSAAAEARHYARGHSGHDTTPGLSTFLDYGEPVLASYGLGFVLLALGGLAAALRRAPKETVLIALYPFVLWIYMSGQRVIFKRNLLVLELMVPIFAIVGLVGSARLLRHFVRDKGLDRRLELAALPLVAAFALVLLPWSTVVEGYKGAGESRLELAAWLSKRPERVVLMPSEVEFDPRTAPGKDLVSYNASGARLSDLRKKHAGALIVAPVFDKGSKALKANPKEALWNGGRNKVRPELEYSSGSRVPSGNPRLVVYGAREE